LKLLALLAVLAALVISGIKPYDRITWWMEVAPVLIAVLTSLLYALIFAHALVLIVGGAYSYARVPLGFWLQDLLGHFMQGFVPAMVARAILLRGRFVAGTFLSLCVALAFSAFYELVEWCATLALGQGADEFLGTQGDPWDTQADMFLALLGAAVALVSLSRLHDRQMKGLSRCTM
jgi:putative membrane protein